jgi:23S rRNA G2445 N2-methylase RlmL
MSIDLRCGDWRDVLADVGEVDAVITDPPYGARTHDGHDVAAAALAAEGKVMRRVLNYASLSPKDVGEFVAWWMSWLVRGLHVARLDPSMGGRFQARRACRLCPGAGHSKAPQGVR